MDFGRPDNARTINRLKVLSALRNNSDMSCAELSRLLLINKVSIGEIVKKLIAEGLVKETGKIPMPSGRPAVRIDLDWDRGSVLALIDQGKGVTAAQCNLRGKIIRMERFSKGETREDILIHFNAFLKRLERNSQIRIHGAVIASDEDWSWLSAEAPFPVMTENRMKCIAAAETARSGNALNNALFIDLDEHVSAAYSDGNIKVLPGFAHLKVSNAGKCPCGRTGCLDAITSLSALQDAYGEIDRKDPFSDPVIKARMKQNLDALAFATAETMKITGAEVAMLTGPLSAMPDEYYPLLAEKTNSLLPEGKGSMIYKSLAGGSAALEGAAILALDEWFFRTPLIRKLCELEKF